MQVINLFDPWKSEFCSCPTKYSFSPYTGCTHGCIYCYASSYIPNFFNCRPKKELMRRLMNDMRKIDKRFVISISNSSDPYPSIEQKFRLTRDCLRLLVANNCKLLIITKSDIVKRDIDILSKARVCVSFTITTLDEELAKKLEPNAPLPEKRLKAIHSLIDASIPVAVRIDPIIPKVNDKIEEIIKVLAELKVKHIISSTFKPRFDSWRRFSKAFPGIAKELSNLYFRRGEKIHNSYYLPSGIRFGFMKKVKETCEKFGLTFACCREGFIKLNTTKSCDGSHLIQTE